MSKFVIIVRVGLRLLGSSFINEMLSYEAEANGTALIGLQEIKCRHLPIRGSSLQSIHMGLVNGATQIAKISLVEEDLTREKDIKVLEKSHSIAEMGLEYEYLECTLTFFKFLIHITSEPFDIPVSLQRLYVILPDESEMSTKKLFKHCFYKFQDRQ